MPSIRPQRVADMLRRIVSDLLAEKMHDPRLRGVRITDVQVSPDLRHATFYFSLYPGSAPERKAAGEAFARASGFLRREVASRAGLRVTPDLRFLPDRSLEHAAHIDQVLKSIEETSPAAGEPEASDDDPS